MRVFRITILVLILFSVKFLYAQDFIVTAKGDTLRGKIKLMSGGLKDVLN